MSYSKGIMWLDDCRIPFVDEVSIKISGDRKHLQKWKEKDGRTPRNIDEIDNTPYENTKGRFTPNLLVCDDMLNDGNIIQYNKTRTDNGSYLGGHREEFVGTDNNPIVNKIKGQFFNDKGSNSRYYDLDLWFNKMVDGLQ